MALGAFIAGLLLAETEFRREIEVTIEPFKGLLLGLFFMSIGAGLESARICRDPLPIFCTRRADRDQGARSSSLLGASFSTCSPPEKRRCCWRPAANSPSSC